MPSASSVGYRRENKVGKTASSLYTGMTTLSAGAAAPAVGAAAPVAGAATPVAGAATPVAGAVLMSVIRGHRALAPQHAQQFLGLGLHEAHRAARLDIETNQGLGVGAAQIEAPVGEFEGHPVGAVEHDGLRRIARFEGGDGGPGIGHAVVELAAHGEKADALAHQLGERQAGLAQDLAHQQPGNHAAVAIGETPEIMMRAHLAAVDAIDLAHALLDEGMAGL